KKRNGMRAARHTRSCLLVSKRRIKLRKRLRLRSLLHQLPKLLRQKKAPPKGRLMLVENRRRKDRHHWKGKEQIAYRSNFNRPRTNLMSALPYRTHETIMRSS